MLQTIHVKSILIKFAFLKLILMDYIYRFIKYALNKHIRNRHLGFVVSWSVEYVILDLCYYEPFMFWKVEREHTEICSFLVLLFWDKNRWPYRQKLIIEMFKTKVAFIKYRNWNSALLKADSAFWLTSPNKQRITISIEAA